MKDKHMLLLARISQQAPSWLLICIFLLLGFSCEGATNNPGTYTALWILIAIGIVLGVFITVRRVLRRRQGKPVAEQKGNTPTGDNSGYDPSTGR